MDINQSLSVQAHIAKRAIYRRMIDIKIDPEEYMKVMAFWMWLEAQGFKEVVSKISVYNDKFLAMVVDEVKVVLAELEPNSITPISHNLCPITSLILNTTSFNDIFGDKELVSKGVFEVYNEMCCMLFKDVIEERVVKVGASDEDGDRVGEDSSKETMIGGEGLLGSHPEGFEKMEQEGEGSSMTVRTNLNPFAKEWSPATERAPEEVRCLFLTFSNGYPLIENQLINFFNQKYGPCVERVYIHKPNPDVAALFGKVVFNTSSIPTFIMGRLLQSKFTVEGKPLWCKRFDLVRSGIVLREINFRLCNFIYFLK